MSREAIGAELAHAGSASISTDQVTAQVVGAPPAQPGMVQTTSTGQATNNSTSGGGLMPHRVEGTSGPDVLHGMMGNDMVIGGGGFDELHGGDGNDMVMGGNDIDELYGDAGEDLLKAEGGDDELFGGEGNDGLDGGAGEDELYGGAGNDLINGGKGDDEMNGDEGADTYVFAPGDGKDVITSFEAEDRIDLKAYGFASAEEAFAKYDAETGMLMLDANNSIEIQDGKLTVEQLIVTDMDSGGSGTDGGSGGGSTDSGAGQLGSDDIANLLLADQFFFAELDPLNNSSAEGVAVLALNGDTLTVITAVSGVEPGQPHPQHIHGFENGDEGNIPDITFDDEGGLMENGRPVRDGFVETEEGQNAYGPILLDLTSPPGSGLPGFPTPEGDSYVFVETYDLSNPSSEPMGDLVLETKSGADVPLTNRVVVIHGDTLLEGQGRGVFAADGTPGYKPVLPIASGEIEEFNREDLSNVFASFAFAHDTELFNDVNKGNGSTIFNTMDLLI